MVMSEKNRIYTRSQDYRDVKTQLFILFFISIFLQNHARLMSQSCCALFSRLREGLWPLNKYKSSKLELLISWTKGFVLFGPEYSQSVRSGLIINLEAIILLNILDQSAQQLWDLRIAWFHWKIKIMRKKRMTVNDWVLTSLRFKNGRTVSIYLYFAAFLLKTFTVKKREKIVLDYWKKYAS